MFDQWFWYPVAVATHLWVSWLNVRVLRRRLNAVESPYYYLYAVKELAQGREAPMKKDVIRTGIVWITFYFLLAVHWAFQGYLHRM
jgi:hypothetical protein